MKARALFERRKPRGQGQSHRVARRRLEKDHGADDHRKFATELKMPSGILLGSSPGGRRRRRKATSFQAGQDAVARLSANRMASGSRKKHATRNRLRSRRRTAPAGRGRSGHPATHIRQTAAAPRRQLRRKKQHRTSRWCRREILRAKRSAQRRRRCCQQQEEVQKKHEAAAQDGKESGALAAGHAAACFAGRRVAADAAGRGSQTRRETEGLHKPAAKPGAKDRSSRLRRPRSEGRAGGRLKLPAATRLMVTTINSPKLLSVATRKARKRARRLPPRGTSVADSVRRRSARGLAQDGGKATGVGDDDRHHGYDQSVLVRKPR